VYACGEGSKGRLGLGHSNNVSVPQLIKGLSQYVIKKVAIHSVGKHCLAINTAGESVFLLAFISLSAFVRK
jgi:E3 ubiquitin-protein ligase HERC2